MSRKLEQVRDVAMELSDDDRLVLGSELMASVPPEPDYERAWTEEIARRLADYEAGRTKGIPAEEVFRKLRERYKW